MGTHERRSSDDPKSKYRKWNSRHPYKWTINYSIKSAAFELIISTYNTCPAISFYVCNQSLLNAVLKKPNYKIALWDLKKKMQSILLLNHSARMKRYRWSENSKQQLLIAHLFICFLFLGNTILPLQNRHVHLKFLPFHDGSIHVLSAQLVLRKRR